MLVVLAAWIGTARGDDRAAKQHAGTIVISPDPVPTEASALAAWVKANVVKGGAYELIRGSPWEVHFAGFLAKDPGKRGVMLVITDASDAKAAPIAALDVTATRRVVIGHLTATSAAGFVEGTTYAVRLVAGKTVLARCTLRLRP